jgi:hypothetical protein
MTMILMHETPRHIRLKRKSSRGSPYLPKDPRVQPGLLKEGDGHLTGHDANIIGVGLAEQLAKQALLLRGEVDDLRRIGWRLRRHAARWVARFVVSRAELRGRVAGGPQWLARREFLACEHRRGRGNGDGESKEVRLGRGYF